MKALQDKILQEGLIVNNSILKVDAFLNYQVDTNLLNLMAEFIVSHFPKADKVITVESSGIPLAVAVAVKLGNIPMVFARKSLSLVSENNEHYISKVFSFTHNVDNLIYLAKKYLKHGENVLIVDDFLAAGSASTGLVDLCRQAEANVVGVAIAVEKEMQGGRKRLLAQGVPVCACARIVDFRDNRPIFSKEEC